MRCGWRVSVMRRMAGHAYSRRIVRGRTVARPYAACRRIDRAGASISPPRVESGRPGFSKTCDGDARSAKLPAVARTNAPFANPLPHTTWLLRGLFAHSGGIQGAQGAHVLEFSLRTLRWLLDHPG